MEILDNMQRIKIIECLKTPSCTNLRKTGGFAFVMVSKMTVKISKYTSILMGTVQAAIVHTVLDAVCVAQIVAILSPSGPALC
jgi:Formaldehyde-activating enzyme (Fae)